MGTLIFIGDNHTYELDGEQIPSVSEISRFASREVYGEVNQYALDLAAQRGDKVHKATELLDKYGVVEVDAESEPYIRAYAQFRKDFHIKEYLGIEKRLASKEKKFAGTIDRIFVITKEFAEAFKIVTKIDISDKIGELAIIDLKTSYAVQKVLAQIQLNGYDILATENKLGKVGLLVILHLTKEEKYKLHNFDLDDTLFMSCYHLHKAFEKKKRKAKENNNEQTE